MFELSVAGKYLIPRKKQISVSLIALMSILVISLVVWLVLVFLSVTEGIEKSWLTKLTSLNAPLRLTPTEAYYSSYYYQVDSISSESQYSCKSINEKFLSPVSDPYLADQDREIPAEWPQADLSSDGLLKDPVKIAYKILQKLKTESSDFAFQDYEMSGALMRLQMLRPQSQLATSKGDESQSFLTQVSYLATFPSDNPFLPSLLTPPSAQDLNHLFYLANHHKDVRGDAPFLTAYTPKEEFKAQVESLLRNATITELKSIPSHFKIPSSLLPVGASVDTAAVFEGRIIRYLVASNKKSSHCGLLTKGEDNFTFEMNGASYKLPLSIPVFSEEPLIFKAALDQNSLQNASQLKELRFQVSSTMQGVPLSGEMGWDGVEIQKSELKTNFLTPPSSPPPWIHTVKNALSLPSIGKDAGILLAKNFQESGVKLGDRGYLSYAASTASSMQEQRLSVYVAGFYDPGVLSIGSKCILVPPAIARAVNAATSSYTFDKNASSGIQVWFHDLKKTEEIKQKLASAFKEAGIDSYWKISTYKEYDFAKDLLEQFQSDKYLFSIVGAIILIVACSNIISLLVILVNDKKKEIGILQSMGASKWSIAAIFGLSGTVLGVLSSLIGLSCALLTLRHIDSLVSLLSFFQGHEAFNAAFYGASLPKELSSDAAIFILIATPIISLLAALVPAIKACRVHPSAILRSE